MRSPRSGAWKRSIAKGGATEPEEPASGLIRTSFRSRWCALIEIQKTRPPGHRWLTAQPGEVGDGTGRLRIGAKQRLDLACNRKRRDIAAARADDLDAEWQSGAVAAGRYRYRRVSGIGHGVGQRQPVEIAFCRRAVD